MSMRGLGGRAYGGRVPDTLPGTGLYPQKFTFKQILEFFLVLRTRSPFS